MSQRWQEPASINGFATGGTSVVDLAEQVRMLQAAPEPAWREQARADRARTKAVLLDARQRLNALCELLRQVDNRLAGKLGPVSSELDTWLGNILVAELDAQRSFDHSSTGTCECYPQCAKAATEGTAR